MNEVLDELTFLLEEAYDHTESVKHDDLIEVASRIREALEVIKQAR